MEPDNNEPQSISEEKIQIYKNPDVSPLDKFQFLKFLPFLIIGLLLILGTGVYIFSENIMRSSDKSETPSLPISPSASLDINSKITNSPTPSSIQKPTSSQKRISTITQPPKRIPNPPTGGISWPQEGDTINTEQDTVCFVDAGTGGDLTDIQRRRNINSGGWEPYISVYPTSSTCFSPKEGTNTFSLQYKNKYGEESLVYIRNFTFHKIVPTPTPTPDTSPPVIDSLGGPQNGETISFDSYCFPAHVTDNVSQYPNLWIRYKFEGGSWSAWTTNMSPCFVSYTNQTVTFSIQAKDEAGNESSPITRTFTVQY